MKPRLILIILLVLGFIWRLVPLVENHSFWTDEDHVAVFSRAVLERGRPVLASGFDIGIYQLPQYWLGALGLKIFGNNEIAIRWPSFILGVLTILAVYLLSEQLFSKPVGFLAAFLTTFLNIEILWSNQARPYQAIQFFWLLGTYFSIKYLEIGQKKYLFWAIGCGLAAEFFHPIGGVFLMVQLFIYLILALFRIEKRNLALAIFVFFITNLPTFYLFLGRPKDTLFHFNNSFYYRIFMTRNYPVLIIFSVIGLFFMLKTKKFRQLILLLTAPSVQLLIVSFLSPQPFVRYFYPVFTYFVLIASYGAIKTGKEISRKISNPVIKNLILIVPAVFLIFSLWKTEKISLLPKKSYSLNSDMQEIPEVNWKIIYQKVSDLLKDNPEAILITNWNDTPIWFLGEGKPDYLARINPTNTDIFSGAINLQTLPLFQKAMEDNRQGIIVLDSWDNAIPKGVAEYCRDNLKKELEIDRLYQVQPRYWPVNVYSWGLND